MGKYPNNKNGDPAEFEDVYAGPGMWSGEEPEEPEEPEKPEEPEFRCVYAGPDFFGVDTEPEETEMPDPDNGAAFENVYPQPQPNQFMAVYAGPQYMMAYAGPQPNMGAYAPPQMTEQKKKCDNCGAKMPLTAKFCGKCGNKFKVQKYCPSCGMPLIDEDGKFCTECGTVLK